MEKREFKLRYGSVSIEPLASPIQCLNESESIKIEFEISEPILPQDESCLITVQARRQHDAGYYLHLVAIFKSLSDAKWLLCINKNFVTGLDWETDAIEALGKNYLKLCLENIRISPYGGELCFYSRQGEYFHYKPIADAAAVKGILKLIQTDISEKSDEELAQYFGYLNAAS